VYYYCDFLGLQYIEYDYFLTFLMETTCFTQTISFPLYPINDRLFKIKLTIVKIEN